MRYGIILASALLSAECSAETLRHAASVVDVGGVPRFAVDGKPMAATAVLPSPAGKPDVAAATVLVERMKLGETRVWRIGEVR